MEFIVTTNYAGIVARSAFDWTFRMAVDTGRLSEDNGSIYIYLLDVFSLILCWQ